MLTFRKKILIGYFIVFVIIISLMFPFSTQSVRRIAIKAMNDRATELIDRIKNAPDDEGLIRQLKEQKSLIFFRVSLVTDQRKVLYDSHARRVLGSQYTSKFTIDHPEINKAFQDGIGYHEDYSELLGQHFAYVAKSFDFHGRKYAIRIAFPLKYVQDLTKDFEIGFLIMATGILVMFSLMTWFIIHNLTKPIDQIISAVTPYRLGLTKTVPSIEIRSGATDEFAKLASILNSLSEKIQGQINSITHERNEKQAILESLVEGVIALDEEMHVIYANETALSLFAMTAEQLVGHPFDKAGYPSLSSLLLSCRNENRVLTDTLVITRPHQKIYLNIVAAPQSEGRGAILVMQDMSSHHKMMEMRKDFIANASHELKTPITIIRGFAETLQDNPDLPRDVVAEVTGKIASNCQRMAALIKDLLTITDIEHIPQSRLVECDLLSILSNCISMLHEVYPEAEVTVECLSEDCSRVSADANLIELAFMNLLENAAKYSPAPAHIQVLLREDGRFLVIAIEDKGIGIPEKDLEHIFERFYSVNRVQSQKMGGSGLGLSIVETIIHKHLGTISVDSKLGVGTTFTIRLPKS